MSDADWQTFRVLCCELAELCDADKGESKRAENVRDRMDTYWALMTGADRERAAEISVEVEELGRT